MCCCSLSQDRIIIKEKNNNNNPYLQISVSRIVRIINEYDLEKKLIIIKERSVTEPFHKSFPVRRGIESICFFHPVVIFLSITLHSIENHYWYSAYPKLNRKPMYLTLLWMSVIYPGVIFLAFSIAKYSFIIPTLDKLPSIFRLFLTQYSSTANIMV